MPSAQLSPLSARSKVLPASRSKDLKRRQSRWASSSAHAVTIPAVKHANGVCMSPHRPASPRPSFAITKGVPVVCPPWRSRAKEAAQICGHISSVEKKKQRPLKAICMLVYRALQ